MPEGAVSYLTAMLARITNYEQTKRWVNALNILNRASDFTCKRAFFTAYNDKRATYHKMFGQPTHSLV